MKEHNDDEKIEDYIRQNVIQHYESISQGGDNRVESAEDNLDEKMTGNADQEAEHRQQENGQTESKLLKSPKAKKKNNKRKENKSVKNNSRKNAGKNAENNTRNRSQESTGKKGVFWKVWLAAVVVSLIVIAGVWGLLWKFLASYEKAQPENVANEVVAMCNEDDVSGLMNYIQEETDSPFENNDTVMAYVENSIGTGTWSCQKKLDEYSDDTPVYKLCREGKQQAVLRLSTQDKTGAFGQKRWQVAGIDGIFAGKQDYTVIVPADASVTVNGVALTDEYLTENNIAVDDLANVTSYISKVPVMKKYVIPDLLSKPEIKAYGAVYGNELNVKEENGTQTEYLFESDSAFEQEQEARVTNLTKTYGSYVANDVKFEALSGEILPNSHAYTFLQGLAKTNVWFASHSALEYQDLNIYNYQTYTPECFSCEVTFTMVVPTAMKTYEYPTHLKYTFVKANEKWYIADFAIK